MAAFIEISAGDERAHFAIGNGALEHPEAAIGMDVVDAIGAEHSGGALDALRDDFGGLDGIVLDVDDADAETYAAIEIAERFEFIVATARELEHQMAGRELVEEGHEIPPEAFLHALAGVVAEANVDGALAAKAFEHMIDGSGGPVLILRMTTDVGFVELDDVGVDALELAAQHAGDGHGEIGGVAVMAIGEDFCQHVRAGSGELDRERGERARELVIAREVERTLADFASDDAGWFGAIGETGVAAETIEIADGEASGDTVHAAYEIVDHAVGFGMAGVETVQLAIGDDVDASELLGLEHDHDGVAQCDS